MPLALCVLIAAAVAGAPVFVTLGGAALILFLGDGVPIASVALDHYRLFGHPSLPAIPLFTLAGYLLAEGGTPRRLVRVFDRLFGGLRGGAALATVACCMLFMCFTGASGVTVVALGGLLLPMLIAAGHRENNALALVIGSGLPGILIAPSMPLILYAIVAEVNITEMFLGAALPATVLALLVAVWGVRHAPRLRHRRPFDGRRAWRAVRAAGWELLTPLVAIVSIFSGYATPVEAAALTATYTFVVTVLVRRELGWSTDLPRVMAECGLMVGGILLILGVALGFTNYLVDAQVTDRVLEWVTASIDSRWTFLLALNILLLVVGCLMDVYSAVIIMTPLLVPVALAFGVSPIHLGVIFLANLELGFLTPPVGMNLFFAAYRFDKPMPELCRAVLPLAAVLAAAVLVVTYVPWLSTAVPTLLR